MAKLTKKANDGPAGIQAGIEPSDDKPTAVADTAGDNLSTAGVATVTKRDTIRWTEEHLAGLLQAIAGLAPTLRTPRNVAAALPNVAPFAGTGAATLVTPEKIRVQVARLNKALAAEGHAPVTLADDRGGPRVGAAKRDLSSIAALAEQLGLTEAAGGSAS